MKTPEVILKTAAGTTLAFAGVLAPAAAIASEQTAPSPDALRDCVSAQEEESSRTTATEVRIPHMQGEFSFSQTEVTPVDVITRVLYRASDVLCGAGVDSTNVTAETAGAWNISVSGDVDNAFTATIADLTEQGAVKTVLGCTCTGNTPGGLASVNANVTGVTLRSILERAGVSESANAIAFVADDGYTVRLPLSYVTQRYSMIVYEINGEALCDVAGSANQLWLGATSGRYFAQNVSKIMLSTESEADLPPTPGTPEAKDQYLNRPNVSVTEGAPW